MITKERLKKLYDKGLSMMEIAERTGYSNYRANIINARIAQAARA